MSEGIYARIAKRLAVLGLSPGAACKLAGLNRSTIAAIARQEAAGGSVNVRTLLALAPALQTSLQWLAEGKGPEDPSEGASEAAFLELDIRRRLGQAALDRAVELLTLAAEEIAKAEAVMHAGPRLGQGGDEEHGPSPGDRERD